MIKIKINAIITVIAVINGGNSVSSENFMKQLSMAIRMHRKLGGLTQHQLANFAGVGKTVIFDIEHAKPSVQLDSILKVLDVLNMKLEIVSPIKENHA